MLALLHRERAGEGQFIEVPMFETTVAFNFVEHFNGGIWEPQIGEVGYARTLHPYSKPFQTK